MEKSKLLDTAGVLFSYREFGDPTGTPVLMLHGFPDAANAWDDVVALLKPAKRKLRVVVPSMRGYGETTVRKENLLSGQEAALSHDVLAMADALGMERFVIVGHDWGARAGFDTSVLAPERVIGHLGLSSPYIMFNGDDLPPEQVSQYWYQWYFQTAQGEKALRTNAKALCEHIWRVWSPRWKFSSKDLEQTALYWKNPQFATVVLDSYRNRWGNSLGHRAYEDLQAKLEAKPKPKITVPTLYGFGTDDHCVLPQSAKGQEKYFTKWLGSESVKGAGHFPHREQPKAVFRLVEQLLGEVR